MTGVTRYGRCGFRAFEAEFAAYPSLACAGAAEWDGIEADVAADGRVGRPGSVIFDTVFVSPARGPGGVDGALGFADEPAGPVLLDAAGADPDEPLALLGEASLLALMRQDLLAVRALVEGLNPNFDPGDLTVPFVNNL